MARSRFTHALTATTVGTYLVVTLGAMADGGPLLGRGHYVLAAAVGVALAVVAVRAWAHRRAARVRVATTVAGLAYPVQAVYGVAGPFAGSDGSTLHLVGGLAVFAALLLALVWHLEASAGDADRSTAETVETHTERVGPDGRPTTSDRRTTRNDWAERTTSATTAATTSHLDRVRAYLALTKPRLMWLLCLLALAGMGLATGTGAHLEGVTVVATLTGGVLAIGAAGTFNHVYERDRDRRMSRTSDRPLTTDIVSVRGAMAFGIGLAVASTTLLVALVNPLATALTATAIVYYAVVYTILLKPTTVWNTVIGGGAGALPALIGWAAVSGSVGFPALLLAAVVFCWTPAHFYNLAIAHRDDYARAEYPMRPVVAGVAPTRRRICYWLGATLVVATALGVVADLGPLYAVTSAVAGGVFVGSVVHQYRVGTNRAAYRSFHASNAYLGALLVAVLVETLVV
ncbi:heme o synthase [Salinigranum sp. GCM10025319]|uniref:heme o synthase n=1 Tax=Salinigranum sp. GCM10025319 TaxID=3252687 RepID=UPI00361A103D